MSSPAAPRPARALPLRRRLPPILAFLSAALAPAFAMAGPEAYIAARVAALDARPSAAGGSAPIAAPDFVEAFYALRANRPAWHGTAAGTQLVRMIAEAERHGFRAQDFHAEPLAALTAAARGNDPAAVAEYEVVASDAAIRLLHHIHGGKVDGERLFPNWNFERPLPPGDPVRIVNDFVEQDAFDLLVRDIEIKHPQYRMLQAALARYRAIEASGGWRPVPGGGVLKPGAKNARIPALRARLTASGDHAEGGGGDLYDPALEAAVRRFQARHGLEPDGVVGGRTLEALNVPVGARIDQLRLSLERARWIMRGLKGDFVLVNIAGARTYYARGGEVIWRTRSIVGQRYRKTPVFRDEMSYIEVNPTWTVPASIFRRDKLPKIRRDPGYLARGGYDVVRGGSRVDPATVNWSSSNPGVTLVQRPGPKNALGQVKFMFPNKHAVYLHDTDDRSLFGRAERNLSSGCVRIEDPFVFADLVMERSPDWSHARRDEILASGRTTRVNLPRPLPVLLTYFTAWVEDGEIQFREDVYERDATLLRALDGAYVRSRATAASSRPGGAPTAGPPPRPAGR